MSIAILIASILTSIAFFLHAFIGDKELLLIEPTVEKDDNQTKREKWTMARSGWHWVSIDLLLASIGLMLINFTEIFTNEAQLLRIASVYFLAYGTAWLVGIMISRPFKNNYMRLGQWIFCWIISALIFWSAY